MDEALSVMFSNCENTQIQLNYGKKYSGTELRKIVAFNDPKISDALSDLKNLYF